MARRGLCSTYGDARPARSGGRGRPELDTAPREVEVPAELASALAHDPAASAVFDALAYTHRKECARWVAEAKREATRQGRITRALEMLRQGKTRS